MTTTPSTDPWASTDHDPLHLAHARPADAPTPGRRDADRTRESPCHDRDLEIDSCRTELIAALQTARDALTRADRALAALTSSPLHDVEFADGSTGGDVAAFLAEGLRLARAAAALTRAITGHR